MSAFLDPHWSHWLFVGALLASLALVFRLSERLRTAHREVWDRLNRKEHPEPESWALFRAFLFAFRNEYRGLGDRALTALVWGSRVGAFVTAAALALTAKG